MNFIKIFLSLFSLPLFAAEIEISRPKTEVRPQQMTKDAIIYPGCEEEEAFYQFEIEIDTPDEIESLTPSAVR
jgi:hypothetical protein